MPVKHSEKAQAWYRKNFVKKARFEPGFPVGDYVLAERSLLMVSAADRMAYEAYLKLLPRR